MSGLSFMLKGRLCVAKKGGNTVALVTELAKPITEEHGLFLWDVRFEKEGADWFLRILIDSDEGVTLEDCEAVSRPLSRLLDEKDPIEQSYYLEVSSPGIERELRKPEHFAVCIGDAIRLRLIRPLNGEREFTGVLTDYQDGKLTVETETGEQSFAFADCAFVKLADDFDIEAIESNI